MGKLRPGQPVILMGPLAIGKTTTAGILAGLLGVDSKSLDLELFKHYPDPIPNDIYSWTMYSPEVQYYHLYAVRSFLAKYSAFPCVMELGGGQDMYDSSYFDEAVALFEPYENVVSLQLCEDIDQSVELLIERIKKHEFRRLDQENYTAAERLVRHHSSRRLAKLVLYTKDMTPEQVAQEICRRLDLQ